MAATLTATTVKNARPSIARRELPDAACPGLYLTVEPSGSKRWALRYSRPDGRSARLVLGSVNIGADAKESSEPVIGGHHTLAGARRLVATLRHEIAQGRDPGAAHLVAKQLRRVETTNTFAAAAHDFIEQYARKKIRRWPEQARLLGLTPEGLEIIHGGLADRWRDKPIGEIDGHNIHNVVDETRRKGVPGLARRSDGPTESQARKLYSTLSKMFSWLMQHRRAEANPCSSVHRPEAPQARDRFLSDTEIVKFWKATDTEPTGAVLKLLLLTGCRLNEVAGMRRSELSDDYSIWNIPATRTKNGRPHVVPLPPLARDLIPRGDHDLIFTTTGTTPVSGWTKVKRRLDKSMQVPPWKIHDVRRTFVTGCAELGIRPDVIELAVNHVSGVRGGIAGVYNRSELLPERRAALERWAVHVEALVTGQAANVLTMASRRAP